MNNWNGPIPIVDDVEIKSQPYLFSEVLNALYTMNQYSKRRAKEYSIPTRQYIDDFCTIRVKGARGIGHTEGLMNFSQTTLKNKKIVWLYNTSSQYDQLLKLLISKYAAPINKFNPHFQRRNISYSNIYFISTGDTDFHHKTHGIDCDAIIVDMTEKFWNNIGGWGTEKFYDICSRAVLKNPDFDLIMVQ